jgi:hypothetical protein
VTEKDLILGNKGTNTTQGSTNPFKVICDFDRNGTIEQIVTRSINGRDMP